MFHEAIPAMRSHLVRLAAVTVIAAGIMLTPASPAAAATTVDNPTDLRDAFDAGGDVKLGDDITVDDGSAVRVPDDGSVSLDLNGYTLDIAAENNRAGIYVPAGASLTIDDSTGGGTLKAYGGGRGAGIGGNQRSSDSRDAGDITIIGSTTIDARGGEWAAGIGGGWSGDGGTVKITGSSTTVDARGGYAGAGIGGGTAGDGGTVQISGGTIDARGGYAGAGIGGGSWSGDGGTVKITGSSTTVDARGGYAGAGIGGGTDGDGGTVQISGGTIDARGGDRAAGIGGGYGGGGADVVIGAGAEVTATSDASITVGPGNNASGFGSLSNAGQLEFSDNTITIPAGDTVDNSGLMTGDGTIHNHGTITNTGTIKSSVTVTDHNYLLEFDAHGGTDAPDAMRVYAPTLAEAGLSLPDDEPTRTGYTFTGWYPDSDTTGDEITDTSTLTDQSATGGDPVTVTAYAGWQALPPVSPQNADITQSTCQAGQPTDPVVDLPENNDRIAYTLDGQVAPGQTVTITAEAQNGNVFTDDLDNWQVSEDRQSATQNIELDAPDCAAGHPKAAQVTQSTCQAGQPTDPQVDLPEDTENITYELAGQVAPGQTVTLTATAQNGNIFADDLDNWQVSEDRQSATHTINLDAPDCAAGPAAASTQALPAAGSSTSAGLAVFGVLAALAGATILTTRHTPRH